MAKKVSDNPGWKTCCICGKLKYLLTIDEANYVYKNKNGWTCSWTCYNKLINKYGSTDKSLDC